MTDPIYVELISKAGGRVLLHFYDEKSALELYNAAIGSNALTRARVFRRVVVATEDHLCSCNWLSGETHDANP